MINMPRTVVITRREGGRYGLRVQGDCPVVVVGVEQGSCAEVRTWYSG